MRKQTKKARTYTVIVYDEYPACPRHGELCRLLERHVNVKDVAAIRESITRRYCNTGQRIAVLDA